MIKKKTFLFPIIIYVMLSHHAGCHEQHYLECLRDSAQLFFHKSLALCVMSVFIQVRSVTAFGTAISEMLRGSGSSLFHINSIVTVNTFMLIRY